VGQCAECGFVYEDVAVTEIAAAIRAFGGRYRAEVAGVDPPVAATRPQPAVWSVLEYCCHVRDVLLIQRDRVVQAMVEDGPRLARMHRDERVTLLGYSASSLAAVADQLDMAAAMAAQAFAALSPESWSRGFIYSWPAPARHDLAWLGRHTVHEGEHHLLDVRRILSAAA
jgi:hypothetical protein